MEQTRGTKRVLVYYPAQYEKKGQSLPALVKDLSVGGAKILCSEESPHKFYLSFSPVPHLPPMKVLCHVQWRKNHDCGVKFSGLSRKEHLVLESLVKFHRMDS